MIAASDEMLDGEDGLTVCGGMTGDQDSIILINWVGRWQATTVSFPPSPYSNLKEFNKTIDKLEHVTSF